MVMYYAISIIQKNDIPISFIPLVMRARILDNRENGTKYKIEINKDLPLDEKVKAYVHEIIHLIPDFAFFLGNPGELLARGITEERYEFVEKQIDAHAENLIRIYPSIESLIKSRFEEINSPARIRTWVYGAKGHHT